MNKAEREKEIKRRSKIRSKEDYDTAYVFLKECIKRRLEKNKYNCKIFFWVYPQYVGEKQPWTYRVTRFYTIIYFADAFLYDAMRRRLKRDAFTIFESDKYHFGISFKRSS